MEPTRANRAIVEARHADLPAGQVILFEQYGILRRTWYWVLAAAVLIAVAAYFYVSLFVQPEYLASVTTIPPRKQGTPIDNLLGDLSSTMKTSGLTRLLGKNAGSSGYSNMAILTSRAVKDSLIAKYDLFDVYDIPENRRDMMYGALEANMAVDVDMEGPIVVSLYDTDPQRAADMANDIVSFTNSLLRDLNRRETQPISDFMGKRLDQLKKNQQSLGAELREFMRANSLYEPEGQLPVAAQALMEARAKEGAQRAVVTMLKQELGADDPMVQRQESLLQQYTVERSTAERGAAGVGPSVTALPAAMVEYLRLRQDYEVNAQTLALMEPMYEQTRFDEVRDIPALLVLDGAFPPPAKARPKRSLVVASAFLGTIIISYLLIVLVAYLRSFSFRYRYYRMAQPASDGLPQAETVTAETITTVERL